MCVGGTWGEFVCVGAGVCSVCVGGLSVPVCVSMHGYVHVGVCWHGYTCVCMCVCVCVCVCMYTCVSV